MHTWMAIVIGALFAAGVYMVLRRSLVKLVIGLALLGHACNLLIFTAGGLRSYRPPLILAGENALTGVFQDPVPQALILTAIVIGFGVQAFTLVLLKRTYQTVGSEDLDEMRETDE